MLLRFFFIIGLFAFAQCLQAADAAATPEQFGVVADYPGAVQKEIIKKAHASYPVFTGDFSKSGEYKTLDIQGRYLNRRYELPSSEDISLVSASFVKSMRNKGFTLDYQCQQSACGKNLVGSLFGGTNLESGYYYVVGEVEEGSGFDFAYLSFHSDKDGQRVYVTLLLRQFLGSPSPIHLVQDVVLVGAMQVREVPIEVNLASDIVEQGKVVLTGIYFDHDSAQIQSKSEQSLLGIADYLKANINEKFYVVGHTDTVGSYQHNLSLSEARAKAVVQYLVERLDVSASRLVPVGVGPVSPVKSNATNDGRNLNRRVELVVR